MRADIRMKMDIRYTRDIVLFAFLILSAQALQADERPTVGLALGGGGANGLAHIAILEVFDELEVRPEMISGTSIGAIIGALYASGNTAGEIRDLVDEIVGQDSDSWIGRFIDRRIFRWISLLDPSMGEGGLIRGDRLISLLDDALEVDTFEELDIPLRVIATDLRKREQVVFDSGDLSSAVLASIAIPGVFTPVIIGDRVLVDGGLVNPVPFDVLFDNCDIVVAVNVIGIRDLDDDISFMDTTFISAKIAQESILRGKRALREPDIFIDTGINGVQVMQFNKFDSIYKQARPAADQLRQQLIDKLGL